METTESEMSSTSITIQEKEEGAISNTNGPSITKYVKNKEPLNDPVETPKKPFKFKVTVFMLCLISVVVAVCKFSEQFISHSVVFRESCSRILL